MSAFVTIVGGGLAGVEAAYQLGRRGVPTRLYEMRPKVSTAVHKTSNLAELVCSNSLRSDALANPVGLLKREMAMLDSLVIRAARSARVPAGSALAVDREAFSAAVTQAIQALPSVALIREEITELPDGPSIIAAGPLCSDRFSQSLYSFLGDESLYFYDAIAPVVAHDSLDLDVIFAQSRYDKGDGQDYLNIPLDRESYLAFHDALVHGQRVAHKPHDDLKFFEGCLPIEVMAERGIDTLRFGPLKPVGLVDPRSGDRPYAVIQLRQDNYARSHWNMVGFQTQLTWGEHKRIFSRLPGMQRARFVRLGMIHRNTFVNSPRHLNPTLQFKRRHDLLLAGQISGVEGYVESAAMGLIAGIQMARLLTGRDPLIFPATTAIGSLTHYITFEKHREFSPTNINFGIMQSPGPLPRMPRRERRRRKALQALSDLRTFAQGHAIPLQETAHESLVSHP